MITAKSIRQELFAQLLTMFEGVEMISFVNVRLSLCCFQMQYVTEHPASEVSQRECVYFCRACLGK